MPQTDTSAWAYHRSMLKADSLVIAGAVTGVGLVTFTATTLHESNSPMAVVAQACVSTALLLTVLSIAGRALLRSRGLATGRPLVVRFPKSAFLATCLGCVVLTSAMSRNHLESGVAVYRGRQHLQVGNYQAAAECFTRVVELSPNTARGYCLRGLAMFYSGQTHEAYDDLQIALKLQPENRAAQTLFMATIDQLDDTKANTAATN